MSRGRKRSREVSNMNDQLGGGKVSAPSSNSAKRARQNRIRLPLRCATGLFELTKNLGFKRDGMTVEWLIQQSELDQCRDQDQGSACQFSAVHAKLIDAPQNMMKNTPARQEGRPRATKDRHFLTEDGRDRRVRVPSNCISQIIHLTEKLGLKSDGESIEWLYNKYGLSRIRPQSTTGLNSTQSTTGLDSTPAITNTRFNSAYLNPDNEGSTSFSIPSHNHQQNLAADYEQEIFAQPTFIANQNSVQYRIAPSSHPCDLYLPASSTVDMTANQLEFPSYPQQQPVIHPNKMNFQSWIPKAGGGITANDGLIMEGSIFEPQEQMGSFQHTRCLYSENDYYAGSSIAMAGETLVGPAQNLPYTEQIWYPNSTSSTSIPQSYCTQNQYTSPYAGISTGIRGSMNSPYPEQQLCYQGVGDGPMIPQNFRYMGDGSCREYRNGSYMLSS